MATATDRGTVKDEQMLTVWLPTELYRALDDEATRLKRATKKRVSMSSIARDVIARRLGIALEGDTLKASPYEALDAAREALEQSKRTGSVSKVKRDAALKMIAEAVDFTTEEGEA